MASARCVKCARRVPWIAFFGNLTLTFYKCTVGWLGGSPALIADGLHSFTDVIGTSVILASTRVSERPADADHPYGHGKVEFMSSSFIYIVLIVLSVGIFIGGLLLLIHWELHPPMSVTFFAAVVSVIYNIIMYRLGQCAGHKTKSPALLANSFENRADAISSIAVCIGIAAAMWIHPACDPLAAMAVGVVIFTNCIVELRKALSGLMDRALPDDAVERIRALATRQKGVVSVTFVKTRPTGNGYWLDLGLEVKRGTPVAGADAIANRVRAALMKRSRHFDEIEVYVVSQGAQATA
jgi:cation diffusion facilitator family transporter